MAINIALVIGITLAVLIVGGGIGYLIFLGLRPKKITWKARVWQLSEGIQPPIKDKRGNIISTVELNDLRVFKEDIIQRVEKGQGATYYELQKLGKSVPAVTNDVVDYWGKDKEYVDVLYHDDSCTLLSKGYDKKIGSRVYRPLPHSRINQIKSEIALRKDRLKESKGILEAITPWVIFGIAMISVFGLAYVMGNSYVEMSENIRVAQEQAGKDMVTSSEIYRDSLFAMSQLMNVSLDKNGLLGNPPVKEEPPKT